MSDGAWSMDAPVGEEWRLAALCAQVDGELWFPEKGGSVREAKRICGRCEAQPACLAFALETRQAYGIWGGKTDRERRQMLRKRAAAEPAAGGVR